MAQIITKRRSSLIVVMTAVAGLVLGGGYAVAQETGVIDRVLPVTSEKHYTPLVRENNPSQEGRDAVKETIKRTIGNESLNVEYALTANNPYKNGTKIDVYWDSTGMEYWVDTSGEIIQFAPRPRSSLDTTDSPRKEVAMTPVKSANEVKAIAERFLSQNVNDFDQVKTDLAYSEVVKEAGKESDIRNYFFRWEDKDVSVAKGELAPFIQVGVSAGGEVFNFTDTVTSKSLTN